MGTWGGGGLTDIYFKVFLSYNAVASLDYISLRAGRVKPGVGDQGHFFARGQAGVKTNLNKKKRGQGKLLFFSFE